MFHFCSEHVRDILDYVVEHVVMWNLHIGIWGPHKGGAHMPVRGLWLEVWLYRVSLRYCLNGILVTKKYSQLISLYVVV